MENVRPTVTNFEVVNTKEVDDFLCGYHDAKSKEDCLKNAESKPSITEQHHAYAVQCCNDEQITYLGGAGGEEEKAKDEMSRL
eukprot:15005866-Ditylum_brightwellii.AAC.1